MLLTHALRSSVLKEDTGGITLYSLPGATVNTQNTYSIRVPDGVTSIAALAIGAGGGGGGCSGTATAAAGGGGGGALSYSNSISVTPGETLTILIPNQAASGTTAGTNGSNGLSAVIRRNSTDLLLAVGGSGSLGRTGSTASNGASGGSANSGIGDVRYSGGNGGNGRADNDTGGGGGGAAGYGGDGGVGGTSNGSGGGGTGEGGTWGAGGGGSSYVNNVQGGSGGGTLWYGRAVYGGVGGTSNTSQYVRNGKLGSSYSGSDNIFPTPIVGRGNENVNGLPGGGGAGAPSGGTTSYSGMRGAGGAVRILWGKGYDWYSTDPDNAGKDQEFRLRSSASSSTSSITIPEVELGDTIVFVDFSQNTTGTPTAVTPAGFTSRMNNATGVRRLSVSTKLVLSSAETGTSITGANGTAKNAKIIAVISGKYGANYSPLGDLPGGTGTIGTTTDFNYTYEINVTDTYAKGFPVNFFFLNSTEIIDPNTNTTDVGFFSTYVVRGPDDYTYLKIGTFGRSNKIDPNNPMSNFYFGGITTSTLNTGTKTYRYWSFNFF